MKFTIVGAGSSYTPELLDEMIVRREVYRLMSWYYMISIHTDLR